MKKTGILMLLLTFCMPGLAVDKKQFEQRYKGKYVVVLRPGISVGFRIYKPDAYFSAPLRYALPAELPLRVRCAACRDEGRSRGEGAYKYKDMTVEFHNGKVTDVR